MKRVCEVLTYGIDKKMPLILFHRHFTNLVSTPAKCQRS